MQLIEFSDFECPFCATFHKTVKPILERYPEDVALTFVHLPLAMHRTKVSVLEGVVRVTTAEAKTETSTVTAPLLKAGEEVEVQQSGRIDQPRATDVAEVAAWTQRQVVFKQEPLDSVIREFNRYRKTPQIRVEDAALAARRYSGIFDIDDPESLEDVLANERDVSIERSGEAIIIRPAGVRE